MFSIFVTDNVKDKMLAYFEICLFLVIDTFLNFYSTGPLSSSIDGDEIASLGHYETG